MAQARANTSHIYYTDELMQRPARRTDYLREKQAMQDLAAQMVSRPEGVLPHFVDLAMELTGGVAAGLSLYEKDPMPGVFRWRYLRGSLAPFEGVTTPRDFSPCGVTLDERRPVLSRNPELVYDWISNAKIVVPEVMLVPLYVGGQEPLGTLWIVADQAGHFDSGHAREITELASFVGIALRIHRTEKSLHAALEEQEMLTREMSHRLKNVFAITEGLLRISARAVASKEELVSVMSGRIQALASAHALVRRNFGEVGAALRTSGLEAVIQAVMQPHDEMGRGASRFTIAGPDMHCGEHALNGVALIFHELATNAAKYGALKTAQGHIDIGWKLEGDRVALFWIERGGPRLADGPDSTGFGTKLLQDTVTRQFAGTITHEWKPEGLVLAIALPVSALQR
jgi:two-component sensor histidine kinase